MPPTADLERWRIILQAAAVLVSLLGIGWTILWAVRSPRLRISLLDATGHLRPFGDSPEAPLAYFYYLRVENLRRWTAQHVRVKIIRLRKEGAARTAWEQRTPVYLVWAALPSPKLYMMDVLGNDDEACILGYLIQGRTFQLDAMDPARTEQAHKWPPGFPGFVGPGEEVELELVALAENARSNPLRLGIRWNGAWSEKPEEMLHHLAVSTLPTSPAERLRERLRLRGPR